MLQGNPFETERHVQERTSLVYQGVKQQRQPRMARLPREVTGLQIPWVAQGRWRVQGWWVPAALAFGFFLGLAAG